MATELKGVPTPKPAATVAAPAAPATPVVPQQAAPAAPEPVAQVAPMEPAAASVSTEGMSNRTQENIDKLLESNQRLYQANELLREAMTQRNQPNQQFAQPQTPAPTQATTPQQATTAQLSDFTITDPKTGDKYVDEAKLRQTMMEIQQRAAKAEETANNYARIVDEREKDRQNSEAFTAYPDLNPRSTQFDARFSNQTRALITDSMLNPHDYNGRPLTFREAADFIRETTGKPVSQQPVAAPTVTPANADVPAAPTANQINKEQASLSATPQPQAVQNDIAREDLSRLQMATRTGDDEALAARLVHTDHIFGPTSQTGAQDQ